MALTVVIVFLALAAFVYIRHLQAKTSTAAQAPACLLAQRFAQREHDGIFASNSTALHHRIIAVGDVHGSLDGLLEDIHAAGLVSGPKSCEWVIQKAPTILVQLGDIVDRGSQALEALICLKKLQDEAPQYNARVIRLVGNHDLWWLEGILYKRNKVTDTPQNIMTVVNTVKADIQSGKLVGAFVHRIKGVPIVFVHAGYSPNFYTYMKKVVGGGGSITAEDIVNYTNVLLQTHTSECNEYPCKNFDAQLFEAGPDRGGRAIGGPFWTDFTTIEKGAEKKLGPIDFIQVVGHTMAYCYNPSKPGVHPPIQQAECNLGLVRRSVNLVGVCVDGGMYLGARAYLEISDVDGHFRSYQRMGEAGKTDWAVHDFTAEVCSSDS